MLIAPFEDAESRDFRSLQNASLAMYPALIEEIESRSGIEIEHRVCGILRTARTDAHARALRALVRRRAKAISGLEWVEGETLRRLEPGLAPAILGAAYSPGDSNVNPGLLTQAFAKAAEVLGAEVRRGVTLTGFLGRGPRLQGARTSEGEVGADAVVLAAGPWTELLAHRVNAHVPTPPMRGQMIAYRSTAIHHAVWGRRVSRAQTRGSSSPVRRLRTRGSQAHYGRGLSGMRRAAPDGPALRYANREHGPVCGQGRRTACRCWAVCRAENVYVPRTLPQRNPAGAGHGPPDGSNLRGRTEIDLRPFRPERFG
jgi:glycine/D-amino acid oxidase-like deaminating enzyme